MAEKKKPGLRVIKGERPITRRRRGKPKSVRRIVLVPSGDGQMLVLEAGTHQPLILTLSVELTVEDVGIDYAIREEA